MPGSASGNYYVPQSRAGPSARAIPSTEPYVYPYALAGVTRDENGDALGGCEVTVYRTADDSVAARGYSDASGNYRLSVSSEIQHYVVASYPPDTTSTKDGATVNSLVGT